MLGSGVPTTGVNFGNVGFLAGMRQADWRTAFERIIGGSYTIIELLTVEARWNGARHMAVNDIVLARVVHSAWYGSSTRCPAPASARCSATA